MGFWVWSFWVCGLGFWVGIWLMVISKHTSHYKYAYGAIFSSNLVLFFSLGFRHMSHFLECEVVKFWHKD